MNINKYYINKLKDKNIHFSCGAKHCELISLEKIKLEKKKENQIKYLIIDECVKGE